MDGKSTPDARSEIITVKPASLSPGARWQPIIGEETHQLLEQLKLPNGEKQRLLEESVTILSRCVPPSGAGGSCTGLVVGNIQSGKTLSFTAVSALARDNGYRMILIITGTVKILFKQSVERLKSQLRINSRGDWAWELYRNPKASEARPIGEALQVRCTPSSTMPEPATVLIMILKNHAQLKKLANLMEQLDIQNAPTLVIDDEADQAGLNTAVNKGSQSSTYRELCRLRRALPHHTYLGYTATPQAPLLINLIDTLSPEFATILKPGADYTGGVELFQHQPSLIHTIPDSEVPSTNNPLDGPPNSLLDAMRVHFLGVTAGLMQRKTHPTHQNRSMLIHPSALTASHAKFFRWVQLIKASWTRLLESDSESDRSDRHQLIDDFYKAYEDLRLTVPSLPPFDGVVWELPEAIRRTRVYEVNKRTGNPSPEIDDIDEFWRRAYSAILVGGQSLQRGFTVEGLTVTYMPRGVGVGYADTIQQRARFYGYNRRYLGYCRVYLENSARDAYRVYMEHEDDLRRRLAEHSTSGRSLSEWRRLFFLDRSLKPTRDNVLDVDYQRGPDPDWYYPVPPIYSEEALDENRKTIRAFLADLQFGDDDGDARRTPAQRHLIASDVSLEAAFERLLIPLRVTEPDDAMDLFLIRLQVQRYLEMHQHASCAVFRMRPTVETKRSLEEAEDRQSSNGGKIEPFQGSNEPTGYPGDRRIRAVYGLTIQVYSFAGIYRDRKHANIIAEDVPLVAIWLPPEIARGMVVQDQGGSA